MTTAYPNDPRPAPTEAIEMAREALRKYPFCFWFQSSDTPLHTIGQVEMVVRRLRQHGNRAAWNAAYQIEQCL